MVRGLVVHRLSHARVVPASSLLPVSLSAELALLLEGSLVAIALHTHASTTLVDLLLFASWMAVLALRMGDFLVATRLIRYAKIVSARPLLLPALRIFSLASLMIPEHVAHSVVRIRETTSISFVVTFELGALLWTYATKVCRSCLRSNSSLLHKLQANDVYSSKSILM